MKIAILGFGREGHSVLKLLQNRRLARLRSKELRRASAENEIWILDKNSRVTIPRGIHARLGKNYLKHLEQFDVIFRSPGIPYNVPELVRARVAGVNMSSATKLFFDEAEKRGTTIIGITGSKGKTTTATLLHTMLKAADKDAYLAGNVGVSSLDILTRIADRRGSRRGQTRKSRQFVVLEMSSFQLQDLKTSPHIAVVLDIFPEHQDSHDSLSEYYSAKASIARYQKKSDTVFFFAADRLSRWIGKHGHGKKIAFNAQQFDLFAPSDVRMKGTHSFKNAALAATVALSLGVPKSAILRTVKNFPGVPHRLQLIRTIRIPRRQAQKFTQTGAEKIPRLSALRPRSSAIYFYNDSASHNPHATAAALRSFSNEKVILIAGGKDRPTDYRSLKDAIQKSGVAAVVLFGENKKKIAEALHGIKNKELRIKVVKDLQRAVSAAYKIAVSLKPKTKNRKPVCVLLSPGAPSYDMFKNFEERGRAFVRLVRKLKSTP